MKKTKKPTKKGLALDIDVGPAQLQLYVDGKADGEPFVLSGQTLCEIIAKFAADAIEYKVVSLK
jgi:hypothetical protein